jgi:RNA polymerase sigma factor (sigma-70 family)
MTIFNCHSGINYNWLNYHIYKRGTCSNFHSIPMRLVRHDRSAEGSSLLVGAAPQSGYGLAPGTDPALFAETYERLHGRLVDHAERFLGREDARDAVGDAVASLWIQWSTLSPEKRTDAYIFGIVSHCVSAKRREDRKLVSLEDAGPELDRRAMAAASGADNEDAAAEVLDAALAAMPPRRREVLLLVREQSFTRKQAAAALGLSVDTIGTHLRLAADDLRAAFTRAGLRIANLQPRRLPWGRGGDANESGFSPSQVQSQADSRVKSAEAEGVNRAAYSAGVKPPRLL